MVLRCEKAVARMEPTGRREAPPDDRLREIRDSRDAGPGLRFAPSGLQLIYAHKKRLK